ncbi:ABC transporter substrate-binding protein [Nesterenkonia alkaliphila]|uniref:Extracellular solute-binding protein n=1 Tax=Nesterenkonia alkaliphila TaxID=1463631 RepID=A0A7K1UF04_9MICC|nr:extracellular solute-binding protein [Nesterenkonia alkaliphila]MVT25012.1 extracellular solute-binding protein [Nesterenkonia alkaliphila]GFZ87201.1 sugar ABC transporter substrate-binding protein [Nesterenkonia alkaliphila]
MTTHTWRRRGAAALSVLALGLLAGCGGGADADDDNGGAEDSDNGSENGSDNGGSASGEDVTITWWHNATGDPLNQFWEDVAQEFMDENTHVTIEVTAYQNEELQGTLIPNQLRAGDGLDLYQSWGAGELADQVAAGYVMDVSDAVADAAEAIGGTVAPWEVEGAVYGLPYSFGLSGFWYNTELFEEAGIDAPPETLSELYDAIEALKAADITPIAVGAGDGWPAAHYWYQFALKSCDPDVLQDAQLNLDFSDGCFVEAGELLQEFIDTEPFQDGYLATSAQQGAGSSAGMVATGNAAMELMGHWNPGVMGGILQEETGDEEATPPEFLDWFNFPAIEGSAGDPTAGLGGGDGFSCTAWAPPECADFLAYIVSEDVQIRFAETGAGIPVTPGAEAGIEDENLLAVFDALSNATYIQLWLDTAYGNNVGGAMNEAIVNLFGGQGDPESIPDAMNTAAEQQ